MAYPTSVELGACWFQVCAGGKAGVVGSIGGIDDDSCVMGWCW